jgi:hypothetical protein
LLQCSVLFWVTTAVRYLLVASVAFLLSIAISIVAPMPFVREGDAFLRALIFVPLAFLLVAISLGTTAELIQRSVSLGSFTWSKALLRSLMALPIAVGPVYAATSAAAYTVSRRPAHWAEKDFLLYGVSAVFAYFALRIRKQPKLAP